MDFERVIDQIASYLEEREVSFFLIGGLAMHAHGSSRLTSDVDLLTWEGARLFLVEFMEGAGYETLHESSGFSNHLHPDQAYGRVDFVYSTSETIEKLTQASTRCVAIGGHAVPVPSAEHLIAMKLLAIKNEPRRTLGEMADIQHLMSLPETDLTKVREYFEKYGLTKRYDEIREVAF